jgi:cytochrome c oxidase cbb3-type subunit 2
MLGVVLPAIDARDEAQAALPGAEPSYGEQALDGREVYVTEGCWYCHTRQVRPISTDFGLGRVSLPGTFGQQAPDVFGTVRVGPDLARAGTREPTDDAGWIVGYLRDPVSVREGSSHPPYAYLSDADLQAVAQFLVESR